MCLLTAIPLVFCMHGQHDGSAILCHDFRRADSYSHCFEAVHAFGLTCMYL